MSALTDAIKSRGHWRMSVRPTEFVRERCEYGELEPLIRQLVIQVGGWSFPPLLRSQDVGRGRDWVGVSSDRDVHKEVWRLFQSGQFAYLGGFWMDWDNGLRSERAPRPPRELLGVEDVLRQLTVFFLFASSLVLSAVGSESVVVRVGAHGLAGRVLWIESPDVHDFDDILGRPKADIEEYVDEKRYSRSELSADAAGMARRWAAAIYERCGWQPADASLEDMQSKMLRFIR